jgi:hypothetical protein
MSGPNTQAPRLSRYLETLVKGGMLPAKIAAMKKAS